MDQHEPPVGPCREAPDMGKVFFWLPKQDKVLGRPDRRAAQRKAARAREGFQSHCPLVWLWTRVALMICKATGGSVNLSVACQRVWWEGEIGERVTQVWEWEGKGKVGRETQGQ